MYKRKTSAQSDKILKAHRLSANDLEKVVGGDLLFSGTLATKNSSTTKESATMGFNG
ncbi:MAG TPA: hypothetical protein VHT91_44985 [Kofleriaceae bacterium]|jgi:hypothetical protein|nr:hypothetical protein [Kofleriaceae bacterium]